MSQSNIDEIVKFAFTLQLLNKVYHWNTQSYAKHKATCAFNTSLLEIIDKFVEVYIGRFGVKPNISNITLDPSKLTDDGFIQMLHKSVNYLETFDAMFKKTELLNIRDELLASINQTIYLLNLK
jgi:hypothetical protein